MADDIATMKRPQLEAELTKSVLRERALRQQLGALEADASALREKRSALLSSHADLMAETRTALNVAVRRSTLIRERLRATDLVAR